MRAEREPPPHPPSTISRSSVGISRHQRLGQRWSFPERSPPETTTFLRARTASRRNSSHCPAAYRRCSSASVQASAALPEGDATVEHACGASSSSPPHAIAWPADHDCHRARRHRGRQHHLHAFAGGQRGREQRRFDVHAAALVRARPPARAPQTADTRARSRKASARTLQPFARSTNTLARSIDAQLRHGRIPEPGPEPIDELRQRGRVGRRIHRPCVDQGLRREHFERHIFIALIASPIAYTCAKVHVGARQHRQARPLCTRQRRRDVEACLSSTSPHDILRTLASSRSRCAPPSFCAATARHRARIGSAKSGSPTPRPKRAGKGVSTAPRPPLPPERIGPGEASCTTTAVAGVRASLHSKNSRLIPCAMPPRVSPTSLVPRLEQAPPEPSALHTSVAGHPGRHARQRRVDPPSPA